MELARFDPAPCGFPRPGIPLLPHRLPWSSAISKLASVRLARPQPESPHFRHFSRGRYALGEAYRLAGLGSDSTLLAPSYHCVTMLDPALHLGANIRLYPLHADLSPNIEQLEAIFQAAKKPVKALLSAHFFGFPNDFSSLRAWCDKHGIALIEDCSHVLFTEDFQAPCTCLYGKFVAASPYKFFPCEDGGLLYAPDSRDLEGVETKPAMFGDELRGIKRTIEHSWASQTTPGVNRDKLKQIDEIDEKLAALGSVPLITGYETIDRYAQATCYFSAPARRTAALKFSQLIVKLTPVAALAAARQANYRRWSMAVENLPHCRALFRELPEHAIPYMFPLLIDHPKPHFYWLKQLGFPIWRWDEMAVSPCPVAAKYRFHLLHLPCHQSLSDEQMDWMIAVLGKTLRQTLPGSHS